MKKEFVVLEQWKGQNGFHQTWDFRLVTDGDRIWVEFFNVFIGEWIEDTGFQPDSHVQDEIVNQLMTPVE